MEVKETPRPVTRQTRSRETIPVTLIVGLGQTGLSCARYLYAQGENIVLNDSRGSPPGLAALRRELPDVPVYLGRFEPAAFRRAQRVVVSPGVALTQPLIETALNAGKPVVGDIEIFAAHATAPVVAITGSNGKSTVTSLVADMATTSGRRAGAGGNLGPPALDLLSAAMSEIYILELSSFQLETTASLTPVAATVLNISPDHMDRYPNLRAYAAAKERVFRGCGVMVINRDDPMVAAMADPERHTIGFTIGLPTADDLGIRDQCLYRGQQRLIPISELGLEGQHNVANALAALAIGYAIGLNPQAMLESLKRFKGLAHRCEVVAEHDGVRWLNDSKATNIGATVAAVRGIASHGPLVLIAGGEGKGADFSPLRVAMDNVRAVVLIGRDAGLIEAAIKGVCPIHHADSLPDAVTIAARLALAGDSVLLSPACASFDMFDNYAARGQAFKDLVAEHIS